MAEKKKRRPDRYVVFVNLDLKHKQRELKEAICEGCPRASETHVEIADAALLKTWLNDYPHLRAAYFGQQLFQTWKEWWSKYQGKNFRKWVELVGREKEVEDIRSLIDASAVQVIVLTGPHEIGKSRLALEASKHRPHDVVVALDPRSTPLNDYRSLVREHGEVVCIVEDSDPDFIQGLVTEALSVPNLKLLMTVSVSSSRLAPSFGTDQRVQVVRLGPLNDEQARELLGATNSGLDSELAEWIIRHAGGVPGILLAAASVGGDLRRTPGRFTEEVGRAFAERLRENLGPEALASAGLLSLLSHVGVNGEFEGEVGLLCQIFGDNKLTQHQVLTTLEGLARAGLAMVGGSFAEISPPFFANHLARQQLKGRKTEVIALYGGLEWTGRIRLLSRLADLSGADAEAFWDTLFESGAPLGSLDDALQEPRVLSLAAAAAPQRTLDCLDSGLGTSSLDKRLAIAGGKRRALMCTLEQLLFREKTSRRALRLVWLLAEAENEKIGNNATGVFCESFHPLHPQMPLSLGERLEALREFASPTAARGGRRVAVTAITRSVDRAGFFVRYSRSTEPLARGPKITYGELQDYLRGLVDLAFSLAGDADRDVASVAQAGLQDLTAELCLQGSPEDGLERFRKLVSWALHPEKATFGVSSSDVSSLSESLSYVCHQFKERLDDPQCPEAMRDTLQAFIAKLSDLKISLEQGSFSLRLKRWAGRWLGEDSEPAVADKSRERCEEELEKLAQEAQESPQMIGPEMVEWLVSPAALKVYTFFYYLGHQDHQRRCLHVVELLGRRLEGSNAFAAYWRGWAKTAAKEAEARLEYLTDHVPDLRGEALVAATTSLPPSETGIKRIERLLADGRVKVDSLGHTLGSGRWLEGVSPEVFSGLVETVAGKDLKDAHVSLALLAKWKDDKKILEKDLAECAWRCLESDPHVQPPLCAHDLDSLAASLARNCPERGFKLLESVLLKRHPSEGWDVIDPYGQHELWNALHWADRRRLLDVIMRVAKSDALRRFEMTVRMQKVLDQETDRDALVALAKANEDAARIVAEWLTSAKPGFWPVVFEIHSLCPGDTVMLGNLVTGIRQGPIAVTCGNPSSFYEQRKAEVERVRDDPSTPPAVRSWLREVAVRLGEEVNRKTVWEYDVDVNQLAGYIDDKSSSHRLWAIARVLKYADWSEAKKLLSPEDVQEALPQIDLPEKKRKTLERALKVWLHGR
ncbi:MAG: ATP-binding protein [Planctomycetes bacterium]|nr:ATP-binding protein [Planctomycetota bacterium]